MADDTMSYPVKLSIDYPDKPLNRLTTFFRIIVAIPIFVILALLTGAIFSFRMSHHVDYRQFIHIGYVFLPVVLMILFRRKYPRWWFDWNLALVNFCFRVSAYLLLLRDEYPSTDEDQAVHVEIPYPDANKDLNRWMPLVKWFLAIPHFFVLCFLFVGVLVCIFIAWFAILFTGRYPRSLFDFVVGVQRWSLRVNSYCILLVTDKYPPFTLAD